MRDLGSLYFAFSLKTTLKLDGKGILRSFLMALAGRNVQLSRSSDAKTASKMLKRQTWDRLTNKLTDRSTDTLTNTVV